MKSALVFLTVFSFSALAFAQGAPADPSAPSALAQSGPAWQAAVLVFGLTLLPLLDKMFTAGEWPFGWALTVKYRFVVLALIGGALTCLQAVQGGTSWGAAAITAALAVIGTIMKNGASLFGGIVPQMVPAPPATAAGSAAAKMASKRPPPMVPPLAMLLLCLGIGLGALGATVHTPGRHIPVDAPDVPNGSVLVSPKFGEKAYWLAPSKTVTLGGATGCAALQTPEAKTIEKDAAKVAECVLPKLVLGETYEQIAIECTVDLLTVQRIGAAHLSAQKLRSCERIERAPAPQVSP